VNWKFGDNINTDLITPGRYNVTTDPEELAKIAFVEYRPEFAKNVKPGDFIVAGANFGCGSSRETAITSLKHCHLTAILAASFARIFYRNAMNAGLVLGICDTASIEESDTLELDIEGQTVRNVTQGTELAVDISPMMLKLHAEGGIIPFLKKNGLEALDALRRL
jgi:3-isopropylmalate/(R)-2-methylmalate dehydratase small subunit